MHDINNLSTMRSDVRIYSRLLASLTTLCLIGSYALICSQILPNLNSVSQVSAFHLSFGHRILNSGPNPQLNPASSLIRPIECKNVNNQSEAGICMFSIDCMQNKGVPLSVCKHNYFVGTCCKLPDYNNFVGIVYDLRDTETNQILEARKVVNPQAIQVSASIPSEGSQIAANSPSIPQPEPARLTAQPEIQDLSGSQDKYIISVSSLFPAPTTTGKPDSQPDTSSSSSQLNNIAAISESARNADGLVAPLIVTSVDSSPLKIAPVVLSGELDSFQIQSSPGNFSLTINPTSNFNDKSNVIKGLDQSPQSAYDIIKDESLDVVSTMNSAHSKPTTVGQISSESSSKFDVLGNIINTPHEASQTFSPFNQMETNVTQKYMQLVNVTHEYQSTTSSPAPLVQTTSSDQEFTLTSAESSSKPSDIQSVVNSTVIYSLETPTNHVADANVTSINSNQSDTSPATTIAFSASSSTFTTKPTSIETIVSSESSPQFVDLISSSIAQTSGATGELQTTTPFTTSLSTALLPNISSRPWTPTEVPKELVSSSNTTQSSTVSSSSSSASTLLATSSQAYPSSPSSDIPMSFAHLYSNHHSSSVSPSTISMIPSVSNQNIHHISLSSQLPAARPNIPSFSLSNLQASSKIVTANSNVNHLIPGLSGLQSAILSHIPFKLASGLSSGLSSYLQAAMKPSGNRPLISSNTATALQYQQNMTTSKPSDSSIAVGPNRTSGTDINSTGTMQASADQSLLSGSSHASATQGETSESVIASRDSIRFEAQQICGRPQVESVAGEAKRRVARIVGGNQSAFGQWPWMVSLRQWRKGAFLHKCGAALLNENWAITAAHCVENVKAPDLLLRLGEFDVSNQDEPYPYIERRVKTVVSHPSFDPKTFEYDLALLRFTEPVKFERNIIPVCVPTGNDSYVDRMATVIGWGRLYEDGPLPDIIQHVDVPIITNNECEKMYKNAGYIEEIPDMFICAGINKGGRDSCEGDSGGPLTMVDNDGRSYLVGIISWGIGCALPSQPGVYTRITAFSGWINQITGY